MAALELDPYVVDTLMPDLVGHDRQPSAFLVYLLLWRAGEGRHAPGVALSLRDIAERTGLSKRTVQSAVRTLARRRLLTVQRGGPTECPTYAVQRPWARGGLRRAVGASRATRATRAAAGQAGRGTAAPDDASGR